LTLRSLTSSTAHSRASGIFPASLKARAFAKAWLSADRSAADSFPDRVLWALRSAADVLRMLLIQPRFGGRQISTVNASIATVRQLILALSSRTDLATARPADKWRLCQRRPCPWAAHAATNRPPLDLAAYRAGLADPSRPGADL